MNKRSLKMMSCAMIASFLSQYVAGTTAAIAGPVIPSHVVRLNLTGYRPRIIVGHHAPIIAGRRIAGPAMLAHPPLPSAFYPDPRAMRAVASQAQAGRVAVRRPSALRTSPNVSPTAWPTATPFPTPTPSPTATPVGGPTPPSGGNSVSSPTGQMAWWTIIRSGIGGVGTYGVDVSQGNLLVQAADMDIPNAGVPLNLTRTYNSFSLHDSAGSDGSAPSIYGQDWTNTWDAHIAFSGNNNVVVWDGLGTAYDYTADVNHPGNWLPPAGVIDQLQFDGGNGYYWIHADGSEHYFYAPNQQSSYQAFSGRLYAIYGRNRHTSIYFQYSFNPNASSSNNITQITALAQDGRSVQLQFSKWGTYNELTTLIWPDGAQVAYHYDTTTGHLTQVDEPGNGTTSVVSHAYSYDSTTGKLIDVETPNYVMSSTYGPGSDIHYSYNSNAKVTGAAYIGTVNFQPNDGTTTNLDPTAQTGQVTYRQVTVSYGNGSTTTISDTDGHTASYAHNSSQEVTSISENTGDPAGGVGSLSQTITWFPNSSGRNHHISSVIDERGNETDFAFDNVGDLLGIGRPPVPTPSGTLRPTTWISYDANHNITAECDSNYSAAHGMDWGSIATPAPNASPTPCPAASGTGQITYLSPVDGHGYAYEPSGEINTTTDPTGYQYTYAYASTSQGGQDLGLPTSISGASFPMNGNSFQPTASTVYDLSGNVLCLEKGSGHWSTAQYDIDGRILAAGDADDYIVNGSACSKSQGPYADAVHFEYFANGQLQSKSSASQWAAIKQGSAFLYDGDGNLTTETRWVGGPIYTTTTRIYDAADRLVEVEEPQDGANDLYSYQWLTRYLYDLNDVGGSTKFQGATVTAHGNLYKMQRYLAVAVQYGDASPTPAPTWMDTAGTAYDELDRVTDHLAVTSGQATATPVDNQLQYDAANNISSTNAGLLSVDNYGGNYAYDALGRASQLTYYRPAGPHSPGINPGSLTFSYDPDGNLKSTCCGLGVTSLGTTSFGYDADSRVTTVAEPTASPAVNGTPVPNNGMSYSYQYYANGWPQNASYLGSHDGLSGTYSYIYRDDGLVSQATLATNTLGTYSLSYVYDAAGRPASKTDSIASSNTATTWNYDGFGRISSLVLPGHTYTGVGYDVQDRLLQYTMNNTMTDLIYSKRGELLGQGPSPAPTPAFKSADGVLYPVDQQECFPWYYNKNINGQDCGPVVTNFDARNGAPLGNTWTPQPLASYIPATPPPPQYNVIQYDTANEQVGDILSASPSPSPGAPYQWYNNYYWDGLEESHSANGVTSTYSYDALTRLDVRTKCNGTCSNAATDFLHWNQSSLMSTSDVTGSTDDLKVGFDGDIAPKDSLYTGMTFWDRDLLGYVAEADNASNGNSIAATSDWSRVDPYNPCSPTAVETPSPHYEGPASFSDNSGPQPGCSAGSNLVFDPRSDMTTDGQNVIQGARTFQPSSATWNATDPAGSISGDPMSDMTYAYDNNNPAAYSDPSGTVIVAVNGDVCDDRNWDWVCQLNLASQYGLEVSPNPQKNSADAFGVSDPLGIGSAPKPAKVDVCPGALPLGAPIDAPSGGQITSRYYLQAPTVGGGTQLLGYEYNTSSGGVFEQPSLSLGAGLGTGSASSGGGVLYNAQNFFDHLDASVRLGIEVTLGDIPIPGFNIYDASHVKERPCD